MSFFSRSQRSYQPIDIDSIRLPDHIEIMGLIGEGRRSCVYRASYNGMEVAIKVYRQDSVEKYNRRYRWNIAEFEYKRNAEFFSIEALRPYTVEPLDVFTKKMGYSTAFVQQIAQGKKLLDVVNELGYLPEEALVAGRFIVNTAKAAGIYDLDINDANVNLVKRDEGWMPVIFDFNIMPQYLYSPNPIIQLSFIFGLRDKSYRDYRCLRGWQMRGRQAAERKKLN